MKFNATLRLIGYKIKRSSIRQCLFKIISPILRSKGYKRLYNDSQSGIPNFQPLNFWPGNASRGAILVDGNFEYEGLLIENSVRPWHAKNVSDAWLARVVQFDWLQDLRAVGTESARNRAKELILVWIETQMNQSQNLSWEPTATGNRLANWLGHREFLTMGSDTAFINKFDSSIQEQIRYLQHVATLVGPGFDRIETCKGLILAALIINNKRQINRWCKHLDREITKQILVDGGHISRSPNTLISCLRHLIDIRLALKNSNEEISEKIQNAIDRISPMVRFFRHGDGGLALFNGSNENEGWLIDVILSRSEARGSPINSTPHIGFERLTANRTLLLIDVGNAPPKEFDTKAHAGALSFELSVGKERIITNCGAYVGSNDKWVDVQRATAAHSTVTVEDFNSAEVLPGGGIGIRPHSVNAKRQEADGNLWVNASLLGYRGSNHINHTRRIYLSANGNDIRGEDTITSGDSCKFVARFHMHPTIQASLVRQASSVLIRTPGGSGWRFRVSGGVVSLQESIYLGLAGQVKRSQQIVISSATQNGSGQIMWSLSCVDD